MSGGWLPVRARVFPAAPKGGGGKQAGQLCSQPALSTHPWQRA